MKILHLISGGDVGGAKTHVLSLLQGLGKTDEPRLVCFTDGEFAADARKMGIDTRILHAGVNETVHALSAMIAGEGFEIVHCHGARANMNPALVDAMELELAGKADVVFATAEPLADRLRTANPKSYFIPNGANFERFFQASQPQPLPEDMKGIPGPVFGFVGALQTCIQYDFVEFAAKQHPEWSFVWIGREKPGVDLSAMRAMKNVYFLGMYLNGEFGENPDDVNAYAASTFYAVDRYASYVRVWRDYYAAGGLVLSDRYTTSNAVHQGGKVPAGARKDFFTWLYDFEYGKMGLPKPDLVLCLDMMRNGEARAVPAYLEQLDAAGVDALILADLGAFSLAKKYAPHCERHVSTQQSVANYACASAWYELGARRVVLARELSLEEIREIRANTPPELELETFCHGAMPTAIPLEPLTRRFGNLLGSTTGSSSSPSKFGIKSTVSLSMSRSICIAKGVILASV